MAGARETAALALEAAKYHSRSDGHGLALILVAWAQAKAGDVPGALETANSITDASTEP